jgi:hypothetical protein
MDDGYMRVEFPTKTTVGLLGAEVGTILYPHQITDARLAEIERRILAIEATMKERSSGQDG